jgi:hypothetical protein
MGRFEAVSAVAVNGEGVSIKSTTKTTRWDVLCYQGIATIGDDGGEWAESTKRVEVQEFV